MGRPCGTNERRNACVVLMVKCEGKKPLGVTGRSCGRGEEWCFKEIVWTDVHWIHLARDREIGGPLWTR
jgi:hypothetical protein